MKVKNYEQTDFYHRQALVYFKAINDLEGEGMAYNNIGNIFINKEILDSALFYYNVALSYKQKSGKIASSAVTLHNIGDVLLRQGKANEAVEYLQVSLRIKRQTSNKVGQLVTLNSLGELYLDLGRYSKAKKHLDEAHAIALEMEVLKELKENLKIQIKYYKITGDLEKALFIGQEYDVIKDSLLNAQMAESMMDM